MKSKPLSITILLLIISVGIYYVLTHWEDFSSFQNIELRFLVPLFVIAMLLLAIHGLLTKVFVNLFKVKLTVIEWFGLSLITSLGNYITPFQGGTSIKAAYLKKKHKFSYSNFLSTTGAIYVLAFLVSSILGIGAILLIYQIYGVLRLTILVFFIVIFLGALLPIFLSLSISNTQKPILKILQSILDGWRHIKNNKKLLIKVCLLFIAYDFLIGLQLFLAYRAFSFNVDFLSTFIFGILLGYSLLIRITPGNLGIQEGAIGLLSQAFKIGFNEGLIVATLIRCINLALVFSFGPIFSFILVRRTSKKATLCESNKMEWTGERPIPKISPKDEWETSLERYNFTSKWVGGKVLLDVGCGTGYGVAHLATKENINRLIGVDISKDAIEFAKEYCRSPNVEFYCMDAISLDFADKSFDIVCSFEMLEHVYDAKKFLFEVNRVLRQGGLFILSTPNKDVSSPYKEKPRNKYHIKEFTLEDLDSLLSLYFDRIEYYGQKEIGELWNSVLNKMKGIKDKYMSLIPKKYFDNDFSYRLNGNRRPLLSKIKESADYLNRLLVIAVAKFVYEKPTITPWNSIKNGKIPTWFVAVCHKK